MLKQQLRMPICMSKFLHGNYSPSSRADTLRGQALYPFINDMFGNHHIRVQAQKSRNVDIQTLLSAGFVINLKKSVLELTQDILQLGARIR